MQSLRTDHPQDRSLPHEALPAGTHVGRVRLAVSNLARSLDFYSRVLGLVVLTRTERFAQLGVNHHVPVLLEIVQLEGIKPLKQQKRLGLFHLAMLLPNRASLGSFVAHLHALKIAYGAGDHGVSEAIYLADPDGLNVEVYIDRDIKCWPMQNGEIVLTTRAVDVRSLLHDASEVWTCVPEGTTMGHVHFYVDDLLQAEAFYGHALGLSVKTSTFPGALFVGAGTYHHHVGLNTWAAGSGVANRDDPRMLFWELVLPSEQDLERLKKRMVERDWKITGQNPLTYTDPWGITVAINFEGSELCGHSVPAEEQPGVAQRRSASP